MMVFQWSLSDSKSPQVSRTPLSILAVLNYVVVWMVSTRPPTSKSSSPFSNSLVTVPHAPITIGITVTCMFHSLKKKLWNMQVTIPKQGRATHPSFYYYSSFSFRIFPTIVRGWSFTGVSDRKAFQVFRTLLRILTNLKDAAVWMVSIRPLISNSSSSLSKHFGTVPSVPITIGITVKFSGQVSHFLFFDFHTGIHREKEIVV